MNDSLLELSISLLEELNNSLLEELNDHFITPQRIE